jgi:hypothetical protein
MVRVDMVWHRRMQAQAAQQWLRSAVSDAAKGVFSVDGQADTAMR